MQSGTVKVNLYFFAKSRELTGVTCTLHDLPARSTVKDLFNNILAAFPSKYWMCSTMELIRIGPTPLSQEEVTEFVSCPSAGATSLFIGTTKNHFQGKKVVSLEYEAYAAMAEKQLMDVCRSIREKWGVCKIAILHRTGLVPVGQASVMVAVSAENRREAIEAVSYGIDAVKSVATIWKKEMYEDGDAVWKENKECFWTAKP
ncbi:hypothetical protein EMCRGX_G021938 [Ephydatia muelleri]